MPGKDYGSCVTTYKLESVERSKDFDTLTSPACWSERKPAKSSLRTAGACDCVLMGYVWHALVSNVPF